MPSLPDERRTIVRATLSPGTALASARSGKEKDPPRPTSCSSPVTGPAVRSSEPETSAGGAAAVPQSPQKPQAIRAPGAPTNTMTAAAASLHTRRPARPSATAYRLPRRDEPEPDDDERRSQRECARQFDPCRGQRCT